ncbi:hypothetical protein [Mucilaginibacter sp. SP1R1]|uniref:hypothetical protein n=1 Tax=Mucilaginibacter sp. SP1R1 TaxID=2723091 RepID=UPI00162270D7|nr:hypothetical protein [Mucilaginibacter sp. SP1R1]MBB6152664.1 hypothetical protein [Mucilaginibacter sp. SP1R1]
MVSVINKSEIEKNLFNHVDGSVFEIPGFFEGVLKATNVFRYDTVENLELSWPVVKTFLKYYQWIFLSASADEGKCLKTVFPFKTEEDFESARHIMRYLYQ